MTERYRLTLVRESSIYPAGEQILAPAGFAKLSTQLLESEPQEMPLPLSGKLKNQEEKPQWLRRRHKCKDRQPTRTRT